MPSIVVRKSMVKARGPFAPEGIRNKAVKKALRKAVRGGFQLEMVPRGCKLDKYKPIKVPPITIENTDIVAYCSPDSTYAATKRLFDEAKKSIVIGIYDFTADYMKEMVLNALQRKVKVTLMLDIDSKDEQKMFDEMVDSGVDGVPAPSCASHKIHYFSSSHEKVIVIDDEWCLVQSGNYSENSIPLNVKDGGDPKHFRFGNRDTGLAIRSPELSKFFTKVLDSDMALELGAEGIAKVKAPPQAAFLVEKAPKVVPTKLFPSKSFSINGSLEVQPVLSPDNYMETIPEKLKAARKSILIEQQYIRGSQGDITELLEAIQEARKKAPKLAVRIILGKLFNKKALPQEKKNLQLLASKYKLTLGRNIRYIDTDRFVHCHNKMILVDGKGVLISSQNWSDSAVSKNREAGVWLKHTGICSYFTDIFESDWKSAKNKPTGVGPATVEPEALQKGGYVRVSPADYQEV